MKKKIICTLLTMVLVLQSVASFADYVPVYERRSQPVTIAEGTTHQTIQRYTDGGWIQMNVVRVKLGPNVKLDVITDDLLSKRDKLTNLVAKNNADGNIVAGINTDYFDIDRNTTMGHLVKDGKILTTAIGLDEFASFNVTSMGVPYIAYLNNYSNVMTSGKVTHEIDYYNKPYLYGDVTILYDNTWTKRSYGNMSQTAAIVHEILVVDDVVVEIRQNQAPFDIPENGYVICSTGKRLSEIQKKYKPGDVINIKNHMHFKYSELLAGGGAQLVANGKALSTFTLDSKSRAPRTAIGISKDRQEVILVTIDGRSSSNRGVTMPELAAIMVELGSFEAINMDGGGSAQMVGKLPTDSAVKIFNEPSDKVERKMYTGLVVKKVTQANPTLKSIAIQLNNSKIYRLSPTTLTLRAWDSNFKEMPSVSEGIVWSHEGVDGDWIGNVFTPKTSGRGKFTATYKGLKTTIDFEVVEGAVKLIVNPSIAQIGPLKPEKFTFSVMTQQGYTLPIAPQLVKATFSNPIGSFNPLTGEVSVTGTGSAGFIAFEFEGLKTHVSLHLGSAEQILADFETTTGQFSSFPASVKGSFKSAQSNGYIGKGGELSYDFTTTDATRAAYIDFAAPLQLPATTESIGLWVQGDGGNDHWLRAKVTDAKGNSHNLTLALNVNWKGWQYVKVDLPPGLSSPVKLDRVYLVEADATKKDLGMIKVDQLTAHIRGSAIVLPEDVHRVKSVEAFALPSALQGKASLMQVAYTSGEAEKLREAMKLQWLKPSEKFSIQETKEAFVVTVNNSKLSIRLSDGTQWPALMAFFKQNPAKPVVVVMNSQYYYNDALEAELLYEQLGLLNVPSLVVYPSTTEAFQMLYRNGIPSVFVPRASVGVQHLSLGVSEGQLHFQVNK